jgi:hypothetical protein
MSGILGQTADATTIVSLYTCPKKTSCTLRVLFCERAGAAATIRIGIREDGDAINDKHYIVYDYPIDPNGEGHTCPLEIEEDDIVVVYASTSDVSFTAMGIEEQLDE